MQEGELGNTTGYAEYMRAFSRQIVPGLWLTGFAIHGAGSEVAIQGRALHPELVPSYLDHLKREASMHGKSFSTLEMQRPMVEPGTASDNDTTPRQLVPAGYVEFQLQSAGIAKQDASGTKTK